MPKKPVPWSVVFAKSRKKSKKQEALKKQNRQPRTVSLPKSLCDKIESLPFLSGCSSISEKVQAVVIIGVIGEIYQMAQAQTPQNIELLNKLLTLEKLYVASLSSEKKKKKKKSKGIKMSPELTQKFQDLQAGFTPSGNKLEVSSNDGYFFSL